MSLLLLFSCAYGSSGGITPADLVNLRTKVSHISFYLSVIQPTVLLTALINDASASRGMRTLAYDTGSGSGFATIEAGQTLEVDTVNGTFRTRVKSITGNQTSGSISIDENAIVWDNNQTIRIYHNYEIIPIPPVIRSQVFYKFFDIQYVDQNEVPSPVAIAGPHRVAHFDGVSTVFDLDASDSYAIADGATITDYLWTCVHMGGGTTGITIASDTSAVTTITLTLAGQYWLKLSVTDSNGNTQNTYRLLFVEDNPYKDFTIQSLSGDWNNGGWQASISVTGDATLDDFPDRALILLWYKSYFGGVETYVDLWGVGAPNIAIAGYIRQDSDNTQFVDGTGTVGFQITSPQALLDNKNELGSVSLNAVASPSTWYEYASWMTTGRAIHHLIKWQAYGVLQTCDVIGLTDDSRGVLQAEFTEQSILQQINSLAFSRGIYAKMASDFLGRLHLVKDSQILGDSARSALDTVYTFATADVSGVVDLIREPEEVTTLTELNGFSFNGSISTPFISVIPGYRESSVTYIMPELFGSGTASVGSQILSSQADSNERVGRVHAQANNPIRELRFTTPYPGLGAFDIIDDIGFYIWGLADNDLKRHTELTDSNLICRSITHAINHDTGVVQSDVAFEPEAFGPDGVQGNYPTTYPTPVLPTPDWTPPVSGGDTFAIAWVDAADSFKGKICIGTLGSPITYGATYTFEATAVGGPAIGLVALNSTQILIAYVNSTNDTVCKILTVSGTTITGEGSPQQLNTNLMNSIVADRLDDTHGIVAYANGGGFATALSVSGTAITLGAEVTVSAAHADNTSVKALSSSRAFIAYVDLFDGNPGQGVVADISGVTITLNTPDDATGVPAIGRCEIIVLSSSSVIYVYDNDGGGGAPGIRASLLNSIGTGFTFVNDVEVLAIVNTSDTTDMRNGWTSPITGTGGIIAYTNSVKLIESDLTVGLAVPISMGGAALSMATVNSENAVQASVQFDGDGDACSIGISGVTLTDGANQVEFANESLAYQPRVCTLISA